MNVFVLLNTKAVIRLFWGTIDFHSRKKILWSRTALFPTFFRISSFVFSRTNTFIQVWNYLRMSKWWQNFHFWVYCPFKSPSKYNQVSTIYIIYQGCHNSQYNIEPLSTTSRFHVLFLSELPVFVCQWVYVLKWGNAFEKETHGKHLPL